MQEAVTVSIVIPSLGFTDGVGRIVEALQERSKESLEFILCHSGPGPVPDVPDYVTVLTFPDLLLAAIARNQGAKIACGEYILFIDDDNEVSPTLADDLVAVMRQDNKLVLLGPTMYFKDDPGRVYCTGVFHGRYLGRTKWLVEEIPPSRIYRECDAIPNVYLVRRSQFEAVGGFDERYFPMDFEESDLAFRLRSRFDGRVGCTARASVFHAASLTTADRMVPKSTVRAQMLSRNRSLFYARHFSVGAWLSWVACGMPVSCAFYVVAVAKARNLSREAKVDMLGAMARGWMRGLRMSAGMVRARLIGTSSPGQCGSARESRESW